MNRLEAIREMVDDGGSADLWDTERLLVAAEAAVEWQEAHKRYDDCDASPSYILTPLEIAVEAADAALAAALAPLLAPAQ